MSQHPYEHNPYQGPPPPQTYPYPLAGYVQPPYDPQYNQSSAERHYVVSQESFAYNAANIPGLGFGGPLMPVVAGNNNAEANPIAWRQNHSFVVNMSPGMDQYNPSNLPPAISQIQARHSPTQPTAQHEVMHNSPSEEIEEGELSESQFEDLYEPREVARIPEPADGSLDRPQLAERSRSVSVVEAQATDFYDEDGEQDVPDALEMQAFEANAVGRERTGSYSPYLSPREIQNGDTPRDGQEFIEAPRGHRVAASREDGGSLTEQLPETSAGINALQSSSNDLAPVERHSQTPSSEQPPHPSFKTVAEARKEAQKAILRLLPLGVRYQNYIDEGFDEGVIKSLFEELHFDVSKPVRVGPEANPGQAQPPQALSTTQHSSSDIRAPPDISSSKLPHPESALTQTKQNPAENPSPGSAPMSDVSGKSEERKDRIARLLAAKGGAKPGTSTAANGPLSASKVTATETSDATESKSKPKTDKELLLQQKLEALQKSREARAQKAAATQNIKQISQVNQAADATSSVPKENLSLPSKPQDASSQLLVTQPPLSHALPQRPPSLQRPQDAGSSVPVPGQYPSAKPPATQETNQRKRPVAADFVDYSSAVGSLKRPFGQERGDSFVIDVSDGSDDEDVEMEVDSPEDAPEPMHGASTPSARKGLSIRDFPPLTDTIPRQFLSPVPAAQTPLPRPALTRKNEIEYERKLKEIEDMRKQIAEMEAKAKRGTKNGSVGSKTPSKPAATPPEGREEDTPKPPFRRAVSTSGVAVPDSLSPKLNPEAYSAKLPKLSENGQLGRPSAQDLRRRLVSAKLTRADSELEQKKVKLNLLREEMARLNLLREEMTKLEAELEDGEAERIRLSTELSQYENSSQADSAQASGSSSKSQSADPGMPVDDGAVDQGSRVVAASADGSEPITPSKGLPFADPHPEETSTRAASAEMEMHIESPTFPVVQERSASNDRRTAQDTGLEEGEAGHAAAGPLESKEAADSEGVRVPQDTHPDSSDHPEAVSEDAADHVALESPPFSPAPAEDRQPTDTDIQDSAPVQISSSAQRREASQEAEAAVSRESDNLRSSEDPSAQGETSFVPYVSPLQYYHAYRFHPKYFESVSGGLKSLTYSNKIDPRKPVCPSELDGEVCPRGDGCEFQHFKSMVTPDDKILLELGNSDDFVGEEKTRFIQGLRELLQRVRATKVTDFNTIAREIIGYRARFLGDESKILPLEGVTV